jgi:hypothetical protein
MLTNPRLRRMIIYAYACGWPITPLNLLGAPERVNSIGNVFQSVRKVERSDDRPISVLILRLSRALGRSAVGLAAYEERRLVLPSDVPRCDVLRRNCLRVHVHACINACMCNRKTV